MTDFRNRVVGYGTKPASQFLAHPLNARKHPEAQRKAVKASLTELGWVAPVIENVRTGNLIDGHERIWQALQADDSEVPFIQVDLAPEEEHLALAILDRITGMAEVDPSILNALLEDVNTGEAALQELLAQMADEAGIVSGDGSGSGDAGKRENAASVCPSCGYEW
jgi:ParB-like chromosome segregation protein Spo0J